MPESHFNKVICFYPATSLKEWNPIQVFFDEFWEILKTPFLQKTSRRLYLFYAEIFSNKIVKKSLRKEKKMETACKKNKNKNTCKTKASLLFTSSLHILLLFKDFFLFSLLSVIYWKHDLKQCNPNEDLSTILNYFSPSVW